MFAGGCSTTHPPCSGLASPRDDNGGQRMTPDERELRRALAERIGRPSPDLGARVSHALTVEKRVSNYLPALALTAAMVLTVSTIGVLVLARHAARTVPSASPSSGALAAWQGFPADRKPRPIVLL